MTTRLTGRIVTPTGVVAGHLTVSGDRIAEIVAAGPATPPTTDPSTTSPAAGTSQGGGTGPGTGDDLGAGGYVVPGFVDIHCHGGGGDTYTTGDADAARRVAAFHLRHGTTSTLASLVTSPPDLMYEATVAFAPLVAEGVVAGIHYEGPYLSHARCGAQNPAYLRNPDTDELRRLVDAGRGAVRMVTIAPELPGAIDAIKLLVGAGVTVAVGHTDATYEQALAGVVAGATVGTHVFNGMPPPHHREPGPVFALLGAHGVTCEFVADGIHLHDGTLRFAANAAGPERSALVTDAIAAAGMPEGDYDLGGLTVTVSGGAARLARNGAIAGSTLTMDAAFRRAVGAGLSIVDAARMAATSPARAIGLTGTGALVAGYRADLVVLDADLRVARVMRAGEWVDA